MASPATVQLVDDTPSEVAEIETALRTISQFGFSPALVKRTLKSMLVVYGGDDGWSLMKENGYEVVIERLLLDQEQKCCKRKKMCPTQMASKKNQCDGTEERNLVQSLIGKDSSEKKRGRDTETNMLSLDTPPSTLDCSDIYSHQKDLWAKHNSVSLPLWFNGDGIGKDRLNQRFDYLHILSSNSYTSEYGLTNIHQLPANDSNLNGSTSISHSVANILAEELVEELPCSLPKKVDTCSQHELMETLQPSDEDVYCFRASQSPKAEKPVSNTGRIDTLVENASSILADSCCSKEAVSNDVISNHDINSTDGKISCSVAKENVGEFSSDTRPIEDAFRMSTELCQRELEVDTRLRARKVADAYLAKNPSDNNIMDIRGNSHERRSQHTIRQNRKRRKLANKPFLHSASLLTTSHEAFIKWDVHDKQWKGKKYKFDVARMSASKLTRRRDGCPNPMFSRIQKCKQTVAKKAKPQNNPDIEQSLMREIRQTEVRETSVSAFQDDGFDSQTACKEGSFCKGIADVGHDTEEHGCFLPNEREDMDVSLSAEGHSHAEAFEVDSELPVVDASDLDIPPGFCSVPSQHSPDLPPGFWEPVDFPPGFSPPSGNRTSCEPVALSSERSVSPKGHQVRPAFLGSYPPLWAHFSNSLTDAQDMQRAHPREQHIHTSPESTICTNPLSYPASPKVSSLTTSNIGQQPGSVCGLADAVSNLHAEPDQQLMNTGNEVSQRNRRCKSNPPNQIFIAGIPDGFDGAEEILFGLVNDILQDFEFVPDSARFPCRIQACGDHAYVAFSSEAVAGIFLDAYHANASILNINGEQLIAARSMHLMRLDAQLRQAVGIRIKGQVLIPHNIFYLGNVPYNWNNEKKLACHISAMMEEGTAIASSPESISIYTFPGLSDVYVQVASTLLADVFMYRCMRNKDHLEKISPSLVICRNSLFLPKAACVNSLSTVKFVSGRANQEYRCTSSQENCVATVPHYSVPAA